MVNGVEGEPKGRTHGKDFHHREELRVQVSLGRIHPHRLRHIRSEHENVVWYRTKEEPVPVEPHPHFQPFGYRDLKLVSVKDVHRVLEGGSPTNQPYGLPLQVLPETFIMSL